MADKKNNYLVKEGQWSDDHYVAFIHNNIHRLNTEQLHTCKLILPFEHNSTPLCISAVNKVWLQEKIQFPKTLVFHNIDNFPIIPKELRSITGFKFPVVSSFPNVPQETHIWENTLDCLSVLLRTQSHVFWSHLLFDEGFGQFLRSFLKNYRRTYDVPFDIFRYECLNKNGFKTKYGYLFSTQEDEDYWQLTYSTQVKYHDSILTQLFGRLIQILNRATNITTNIQDGSLPITIREHWLLSVFTGADIYCSLNSSTSTYILERFSDLCSLIPGSIYKESLIALSCQLLLCLPSLTNQIMTRLFPAMLSIMIELKDKLLQQHTLSFQDITDESELRHSVQTVCTLYHIIGDLAGTISGVFEILKRNHIYNEMNQNEWVENMIQLLSAYTPSKSHDIPVSKAFTETLQHSSGSSQSMIRNPICPLLYNLQEMYYVLLIQTNDTSEYLFSLTRCRRHILYSIMLYISFPLEHDHFLLVDKEQYCLQIIYNWASTLMSNETINLPCSTRNTHSDNHQTDNLSHPLYQNITQQDIIKNDFLIVGWLETLDEWINHHPLLNPTAILQLKTICSFNNQTQTLTLSPRQPDLTSVLRSQIVPNVNHVPKIQNVPNKTLDHSIAVHETERCLCLIRDIVNDATLSDHVILCCLEYEDQHVETVIDILLNNPIIRDQLKDASEHNKLTRKDYTEIIKQSESFSEHPSVVYFKKKQMIQTVPTRQFPSKLHIKEKTLQLVEQQQEDDAAARDGENTDFRKSITYTEIVTNDDKERTLQTFKKNYWNNYLNDYSEKEVDEDLDFVQRYQHKTKHTRPIDSETDEWEETIDLQTIIQSVSETDIEDTFNKEYKQTQKISNKHSHVPKKHQKSSKIESFKETKQILQPQYKNDSQNSLIYHNKKKQSDKHFNNTVPSTTHMIDLCETQYKNSVHLNKTKSSVTIKENEMLSNTSQISNTQQQSQKSKYNTRRKQHDQKMNKRFNLHD